MSFSAAITALKADMVAISGLSPALHETPETKNGTLHDVGRGKFDGCFMIKVVGSGMSWFEARSTAETSPPLRADLEIHLGTELTTDRLTQQITAESRMYEIQEALCFSPDANAAYTIFRSADTFQDPKVPNDKRLIQIWPISIRYMK